MKKYSYCSAEYPNNVVVCAIDQTPLDNPPLPLAISWSALFAWGGLLVGVLGTGCVALVSYPFFKLHHDIGNGAVLWFATICVVGLCTFLIGLPCAIVGIVKRRWLLGWLGIILAIAPVPLGFVMLHLAMALNGFHITS